MGSTHRLRLFDRSLLVTETITLAVQVDGQRRAEIQVAPDARQDRVRAAALAREAVARHLSRAATRGG